MRNIHSQQQQRGQGNKRGGQGGMRGGHQMQQGRRGQQQQQQQHGGRQGYQNPENRERQGWPSQGFGGGWDDEDVRGFGQGEDHEGGQFSEQRWGRGENWEDGESFANRDEGRFFGQDYGQRGYGSYGSQSSEGRGGMGYGQGPYRGERGGSSAMQGGGAGEYYGQSGDGQGGYSQRDFGGGYGRWNNVGNLGWRGEQGLQQQQPRFGRGPKGYKRSDERIKEDVSDRIFQMNYVDASDVEIEVKNGEVTLIGSIPNRNMKWQLESLVESIGGVSEVNNQLRIKREEMTSRSEEEKGGKRSSSAGPTSMGSSQHK